MFFVASKIYWMLASPVTVAIVVGIFGALFARGRFGRAAQGVAVAASALLLAAAATPLGLLLISPLENRFPPPPTGLPAPYGIIILGGALNGGISVARSQATNDEGERVTQAVLLAKRYPAARILFTGGTGSLFGRDTSEAEAVRELMIALGVDPTRIFIEDKSRNTEENASFSAAMLHPVPEQRWLLVTSAFHMTRSMGIFEKAGFNVTAYPVAYRTTGPGFEGIGWELDPARNLRTLEIALHEWIGLAAYRVTGRIDDLYPGPSDGGG